MQKRPSSLTFKIAFFLKNALALEILFTNLFHDVLSVITSQDVIGITIFWTVIVGLYSLAHGKGLHILSGAVFIATAVDITSSLSEVTRAVMAWA